MRIAIAASKAGRLVQGLHPTSPRTILDTCQVQAIELQCPVYMLPTQQSDVCRCLHNARHGNTTKQHIGTVQMACRAITTET